MKRFFSLFLVGCMVFSLFLGCTKRNETENPYRIAVITMMQGGEFWGALKNGARNARAETGTVLEFFAPINESDYDGQIACIQQAVDQKFDALVLAPSHPIYLSPVVEQAQAKGIKIVLADTKLDQNNGSFSITADYHQIGIDMAEHAFSLFNEDVPIKALVIGSLPNSTSMTSMLEGLALAFGMRNNASIGSITYSYTNEAIARKITKTSLEQDAAINLVFALEENTAHGVVSALPEGRDLKILAFGTTLYEVQLLEQEVIDALVVVNTFNIGYRSVKAAIDLLNGRKPIEKMADHALITKDSMFSEQHQRLLFQTLE